jgi:hypothetical protein
MFSTATAQNSRVCEKKEANDGIASQRMPGNTVNLVLRVQRDGFSGALAKLPLTLISLHQNGGTMLLQGHVIRLMLHDCFFEVLNNAQALFLGPFTLRLKFLELLLFPIQGILKCFETRTP